ncbi:TPA: VP2 [Pomona leaf-nosed bat associated polyomavirus]|uniref:VP2 n=1 Tax=Pomona leaf-nosed bat associated polyomavirus TaxID=1885565 RepID=UPI000958DA66|nr:VP2 [Pomona leaf-nosed bat associated polyomavirus]SCC98882.1 TPA: VP2 [Pomona leaf-nosed bat associated polyomavirus]
MGIVASIVAAVTGVAEAVADAAATVAGAAGSAAEAAATSFELTSSVGEAAGDTVPLLDGEEETVFDSSWAEGGYADEGAVNDPWNWEMEPEDLATGSGSRLSRSLATGLAAGAGVAAAAGGLAWAIGSAAASHSEAGQALLESSQVIQRTLEEEGEQPSVPDIVMGFMTPEEYERALEELHRRQVEGGFSPDSLREAENALVYIAPGSGIPYRVPDQSLLMDMAQSEQPAPWFLPGAAGQPMTRGMLRRAAEAARVIAEGAERSQVFRLSADARRELARSGQALADLYRRGLRPSDLLYRQVLRGNRQVQEDIARRVAAEIAGQALDIGIEQGQQIVGNLIGSGVIATSLAAALTGAGHLLIDKYFGPSLPAGAVQIENDAFDQAPNIVRADGGLWRKGRASYLVEEEGRLGTVDLSYYAPETTNRGLPSTEPWFHFPPRSPTQLQNLEMYLKNNWGGENTYYQPTGEGTFLIGDLVLQEAQYRRKNARAKRRPRDTGPGTRTKRTRRARN